MKNFKRAIWGIILVAAAVIIALNSFDVIDFDKLREMKRKFEIVLKKYSEKGYVPDWIWMENYIKSLNYINIFMIYCFYFYLIFS